MKLKTGTTIQNSTQSGIIDVTAMNAVNVDPTSVSGLTTETAAGVLQWGISGTQLNFSQPMTLSIAVDPSYNGDTLDVYRAESPAGPWTQTGIVRVTTSWVRPEQ
jgi:hypothetical protein